MPWIERQPSSATSVSSLTSCNSGLTTAWASASSGWKTNSRCSTPTCVAARPMPLASCISCFIRSTSLTSCSSNSVTGRACIFSAASGYWRICASANRRRVSRSGSSSSSTTCPSMRSSASLMRSAHYRRMDPREVKEIMSQGAIRPETPQDRRDRKLIEDDLATSPVKGRPVRQRLRNFRPDAETAIRALSGPTVWMRRLRAIEDELDRHEQQLEEAWRQLAVDATDAEEFARLWLQTAADWSFAQVNELIARHNRNFPAEARLPMDPRTRDFVKINGKPYQRELLDVDWILARWPADLGAARGV